MLLCVSRRVTCILPGSDSVYWYEVIFISSVKTFDFYLVYVLPWVIDWWPPICLKCSTHDPHFLAVDRRFPSCEKAADSLTLLRASNLCFIKMRCPFFCG